MRPRSVMFSALIRRGCRSDDACTDISEVCGVQLELGRGSETKGGCKFSRDKEMINRNNVPAVGSRRSSMSTRLGVRNDIAEKLHIKII
jgi:hypothetical protein